MSDQEENSAPSLPRRESTIQELDQEASSNDEDANALDSSTNSKIELPKVKKGRGKEKLYSQTHTFPDFSLAQAYIKESKADYHFRYEKSNDKQGNKCYYTKKTFNSFTLIPNPKMKTINQKIKRERFVTRYLMMKNMTCLQINRQRQKHLQ